MTTAPTLGSMALDEPTRRALDRLATKIERATQERDALICDAYRSGAGMREIARAVHLTHPGVIQILKRNGVYESKGS